MFLFLIVFIINTFRTRIIVKGIREPIKSDNQEYTSEISDLTGIPKQDFAITRAQNTCGIVSKGAITQIKVIYILALFEVQRVAECNGKRTAIKRSIVILTVMKVLIILDA